MSRAARREPPANAGGPTLGGILADALAGRPPSADGLVTPVRGPRGARAAIVAFTGHHVVAADVDPAWVVSACPPWAFDVPFGPAFVTDLAERVRARAGTLDLVLVATGLPGAARAGSGSQPELQPLPADEVRNALAGSPNPRRAVAGWQTRDGTGRVFLGRGLEDRWEAALEVAPEARGRGLGRALAAAARTLVPPGETIHAQIAPGNIASLRAALGAGYRPFAAEILFFD